MGKESLIELFKSCRLSHLRTPDQSQHEICQSAGFRKKKKKSHCIDTCIFSEVEGIVTLPNFDFTIE